MDSFSGSLPRKYISFRLGKSTPETASLDGTSEVLDTAEVNQLPVQTRYDRTPSSPEGEDINQFCSAYVANKDDPHPNTSDQSVVDVPYSQDGSQVSHVGSLVTPLDFSLSSPLVERESTNADPCLDGNTGKTSQVISPIEELPPITVFSEIFSREPDNSSPHTNVSSSAGDPPTDPRLNRAVRQEVKAGLEDPRGTKRRSSDLGVSNSTVGVETDTSSTFSRTPSESALLEILRGDHSYTNFPHRSTLPCAGHSETMETGSEANQDSDTTMEKEATSSLAHGRERAAAEALNDIVSLSGQSSPNEDGDEDHQTPFSRPRNELSAHSTTLIKRYFEENPAVQFPSGHQSVSFSEKQVGCLVRAVSEETSFVSFRMMTDLLEKATGLKPVFEKKAKPSDSFRIKKGAGTRQGDKTGTSLDDSNSDGYSSGALTEDGLGSVVYHKQKTVTSDCELIEATLVTPSPPEAPKTTKDPAPLDELPSSQELQTLGEVKRQLETQKERVPVRKTVRERNMQNRRVPDNEKPYRANRILCNSSFVGFEWAKVFATGPRDPDDNKYSFYCRFCDKNVSMYGKGRGELVRHYQRKSHFRIDQRWRYEHLFKVNPITGVIRYYVRGWDGRLLDFDELQKELPYFEDEELVEIGPCYPYYADYVKGIQISGNSPADSISVQLQVFCNFLLGSGDLSFLSRFWTEVGTITNHQSNFAEIDWSQKHILVSFLFPCLSRRSLHFRLDQFL